MGVVWAATHATTRGKVALKLVKRAGSDEVRARMLREARASCAVRHPHVREIYDVLETDDGTPMMVMEYLAGESLATRLDRDGTLPLSEAAALVLPVVSAVGAAHALGIVHRDLKPENIFLDEGPPPTVKVLDFGIAKLTAHEGAAAATAALTSSGALLGTPYYMSPEQTFGEKDLDHRTDVWALGLILYRCLSGVLPTQADNVGQVFKNIVARPLRPLAQAAPDLPPDVAALVDRMLSRARKNRPSDLHEVAEVLERHTEVRAPAFGPASASRSGPADAAAAGSEPSVDEPVPVDPLAETAAVPSGGTALATEDAPATPFPSRPVEVRSVNDSGGMTPMTTGRDSLRMSAGGAETRERLAGDGRRWRAAAGVALGIGVLATSYALVRRAERAPSTDPAPLAAAPMPPSVAPAPSAPVAERSADALPTPAPEPTASAAASASASNAPAEAQPPPRRAVTSAVARPPPAPGGGAAKAAAPKVDILRLPQ